MKKILFILSVFFVFLSFFPTLFEIRQAGYLPKERSFELVHNYVFDYNFYLSRIREGQEGPPAGEAGRLTVVEKYYNQPHKGSLFQIFYLYIGKLGGLFSLTPVVIYHAARVVLGFVLLLLIGRWVSVLFPGWWSVVAYLFIVTAGSWPILVKLGDFYRFSTHWGGWSAIDSLQRITFLPHVLVGQIFLVLFAWGFSAKSPKLLKSLEWGGAGLIAGIIFPPVLIVVYAVFGVSTVIEIIQNKLLKDLKPLIFSRMVFLVISLPAFLYLQVMFKIEPWHALSVFDIQHRSVLPYVEYMLALGPVLPLGIAGLILALFKKEKKFVPFIAWIISLGLLFAVFEHVPQQSPTRFTQMLINVPLGILTTHFFYFLWGEISHKYKRSHIFVWRVLTGMTVITVITVILLGLGVMASMMGWKTDEVKAKAAGTWSYPAGVQLVYPLSDFMDGIDYLRLNTKTNDVVLAYEAAGNYIPAYAGNFVYLGHANTPDEDGKLIIAGKFFKGDMSRDEAKTFLIRENIKYIYFGPQERDLGGIKDLQEHYFSLVSSVYTNNQVTIYKISNF